MKVVAIATVTVLLSAFAAHADEATCSTRKLAGAWQISGHEKGGYCRLVFSRRGVAPETRCVAHNGQPGALVSARVTLNTRCKVSGSITFQGQQLAISGRTDDKVNLMNGIATSPSENFAVWGSRL